MAYAGKLGASRQKAFSHKVRSGCITCKGNRECLGYATPKPKIFTFDNSSSSERSSSEQASPDQSSDSATSVDDFIVFRPPKSSFGTSEENNYLQHFLLITSPMLATYGPQGGFFTNVVPQFAWQSPAVKYMLLALSMTHKKFHSGITTVSKSTTSQAVSHYISAITDIRNNNPSKLQVAVASLVAWALELMQNNIPAAMTHLSATLRLNHENKQLQLLETEDDVLKTALEPSASLAKGLTSLMLMTGLKKGEVEPEYSDHLYSPWIGPLFTSIIEAREVICEDIELLAVAETEADIRHCEQLLSYWFETVRRWDQESIRTPNLSALMLLFNLGLALFPARDVAGFSYSENPETIEFIVESAAKLLLRKQRNPESNAQLKETLRRVLDYVVRLFPNDPSQSRAAMLLQQSSE
ncbi:hypothetical protein H2200_009900 [Cladophialophora chaetospira]|uniref:Uncharacterized protein n=1 Tax=Cladophialophora chaetospira TaxID=386627 RepID=A0AA39CEE8_9EURO|nr:hypothetical protein H2200_009900 [Cladophialophora chaetospira]